MSSRIVVMISGSGTNLQALLDAAAEGFIAGQVVLVVSNRRSAYGLVRAEKAGVKRLYFPFKPYHERGQSREVYDRNLAEKVAAARPDLIVLAGWMRILTPAFLDRFPGRVINLHPALPGQFPGTEAIERAFAAFQRGEIEASGCMVHVTIPEVDAGPVIAQEVVAFRPEDTVETYADRMHAAEHRIIVQAVKQMLSSDFT